MSDLAHKDDHRLVGCQSCSFMAPRCEALSLDRVEASSHLPGTTLSRRLRALVAGEEVPAGVCPTCSGFVYLVECIEPNNADGDEHGGEG